MPDLNDERADRTGPEDAGDLEELIEQIDLAAQGLAGWTNFFAHGCDF
jgi:hypothetical protein